MTKVVSGHKEEVVTRLRKLMLEELQRRNLSEATIHTYLGAVERFARYFNERPDRPGLTDGAVRYACAEAARHAGFRKPVSPHMLRTAFSYCS